MSRYELVIDTDNPDIKDRIVRAFEMVGLDMDNAGELHPLEASLSAIDEAGERGDLIWGTAYEPEIAEAAKQHSPKDWWSRGRYPYCSCGYAPRDNGLLNAHWAEHGLVWYEDHGQLKYREAKSD
jgi:hypothetical protein